MPETVKSLKKQNDLLKSHLDQLRGEFKTFQNDTMAQLQHVPVDGMRTSSPSPDAETTKSLNFLSSEYDDFSRFRSTAEKEFKRLNNCLEDLVGRSSEVSDAIEAMQAYSYQYNVKILGLPELYDQRKNESAMDSTNLCISLFKAMGVQVKDYDIAHRIQMRNASAGPRPIICKFVRRLIKNQVIDNRKEAPNVNPENIGLPPNADLTRILVVEHLTPKAQNLLYEAKRLQGQLKFKFCWVKNSQIYLRKSEDTEAIRIHSLADLTRMQTDER
ncbi:Hypothetical predicted protein [Paramuricea clavata]|uniref:FP protein C-terminal domain-containing protein n=1 Tax=Paramuricea clavata TaxID=317549 RepID=A0A6S7J0H9_PARCT|nr:Hypothetical predicted protein [Paramuricea clavata]